MKCWLCTSSRLEVVKPSDISFKLSSREFAITDSHYGFTGELSRCRNCGFLQCTDIPDVSGFYEGLEDKGYEAGREQRKLQSANLLRLLQPYCASGTLLDIGAGSGILVEQAISMGYQAEGVEPSHWLQNCAASHGLKVHAGLYPHPEITSKFDIITLVDVIEHVSNPVEVLIAVQNQLNDEGVGLLVTPDERSVIARLMGWKWWHYRIAHIGYFNKKTLMMALERSGLIPIYIGRAKWYFSADYLVERINQYLPGWLQLPILGFMKKMVIPLNLFDSYSVLFKKKPSCHD